MSKGLPTTSTKTASQAVRQDPYNRTNRTSDLNASAGSRSRKRDSGDVADFGRISERWVKISKPPGPSYTERER